jgi:hypothetical protein
VAATGKAGCEVDKERLSPTGVRRDSGDRRRDDGDVELIHGIDFT